MLGGAALSGIEWLLFGWANQKNIEIGEFEMDSLDGCIEMKL